MRARARAAACVRCDPLATGACVQFLATYIVDWAVWPAAQAVNFFYLAPVYRVAYVSTVTLFYNVFLSFMKHTHVVHRPD